MQYKAHLVILANTQVEGLDYIESFAPVAKMVIVGTLISITAARKWEVIRWIYIMLFSIEIYKKKYTSFL